jgi:hypothetical protein
MRKVAWTGELDNLREALLNRLKSKKEINIGIRNRGLNMKKIYNSDGVCIPDTSEK